MNRTKHDGLQCDACGRFGSYVKDCRPTPDRQEIVRWRVCMHCGEPCPTQEVKIRARNKRVAFNKKLHPPNM